MLKTAHLALGGALFLSTAAVQAQVSPPSPSTALRPIGTPGVRREAGSWLFNDSIFVSPGDNAGTPGSPAFIPGLRHDKKDKLPTTRASLSPLNWATLPLPPLRAMMAPGYDFAALQSSLTAQLAAANSRVYVGWALPVGPAGAMLTKTDVAPVITKLRAALDAVAPTSALILSVDAAPNALMAVSDIDAAAGLCDAVWLSVNPLDENQIWPLKMARRTVEEQKDYDLPVFVSFGGSALTPAQFDARSLEYFMGGATGFVTDETPSWAGVVSKNAGLFANAVTLEDAAILPSQNPVTLQIADTLRAVGRIPLVGRLPEDGANGESLFAILDDHTSPNTLSSLDKSIRSGASVYMEGLPDIKNKVILDKLSDMTSTTIEVLPTPRVDSLNLSDPWLFGDARSQELDVLQRIKWTVKSSLASQTRVQKGEDSKLPFAAAKLATDANGLLVAPLGKGRLMWLPSVPTGQNVRARWPFYSAIAGNLQGAMTEWKFNSVEDEVRNGGKVRVAMRASKALSQMVSLWNDADTDANITLRVRGNAPIAFDLLADKPVQAAVIGYGTSLKVTIPAHGYVWYAFGMTQKDFDKERLAGRPKAKVIKDSK